MNSVDVYVSTSLSDAGIAASTAEAMACEVPVVITNSGENDKWVKDRENGFLIPISDPEQLAKQIMELFRDQTLASKVGKKGRKFIINENDILNEMNKMNIEYLKYSNI